MSFGVIKLRSPNVISVSKIDPGGFIWHDRTQKKNNSSANFGILQD